MSAAEAATGKPGVASTFGELGLDDRLLKVRAAALKIILAAHPVPSTQQHTLFSFSPKKSMVVDEKRRMEGGMIESLSRNCGPSCAEACSCVIQSPTLAAPLASLSILWMASCIKHMHEIYICLCHVQTSSSSSLSTLSFLYHCRLLQRYEHAPPLPSENVCCRIACDVT